MISLFRGRDFISCHEWTLEELEFVIEHLRSLKRQFKSGATTDLLKNKTLFMLFYATSTRTRNSFEAAMTQLGGHAHFLETKAMRMGDSGAPEAIKDTAKVLDRYGHGIAIRVYTPNYGGGIPVVMNNNGHLEGVFAVIDKDKAGERMAEAICATDLLILTDVEYAMLNFGKPNQEPIGEMTVRDAENYLMEGHFIAGSMGPKVEACLRFLKWGGNRAAISSLDKLIDAYDGKTVTHIHSKREVRAEALRNAFS